MQDFEKLGVFYLGSEYDIAAGKRSSNLLLYDSKDLVTHAVCVGMTGSGKTGLCIGLLEEAAIDGIPAIVIDPKGDIGNLMLQFPGLTAAEFAPWVNEDDARRKGLTREQYAQQQADLWKRGLGEWGQDGARIQRLKEAADVAIYTPASNAGLGISILKSFQAPPAAVLDEPETLRERISTTVSSLLGLLGVDADAVQSREHILISTILHQSWKNGRDLDLAALIQAIQAPPFQKIGVMDLESFFPAKERFALSMRLNNLLASPGFDAWMQGEALEIDRLLYTPAGKPRIAIFSIAHLGDAERMFFVSLLLNQVLGWMRQQSGTTSLRALLYMDEIFGYFPPVANPPSKTPLLTLLKQARAFGLGVVLATQNPVDLDYKGLANAGTWFIGRLQTERDKARVLDGLESAAGSANAKFDRKTIDKVMSSLGNRVFLMNNVHEDAPVVFESRWALSYLRGPLSRDQIRMLMAPAKSGATPSAPVVSPPETEPTAVRPVLPPGVPQGFVPSRAIGPIEYVPALMGCAKIYFSDTKSGSSETREFCSIVPLSVAGPHWETAREAELTAADLEQEPQAAASFAQLPPQASQPKSYDTWKKDFAAHLYRTASLDLLKSAALNMSSRPGESERDFQIRLQQAAREQRDEAAESLRQKYAPKLATLQDRIRRAHQAVEREQEQATSSKWQAALTVGASILGAFLGRKTVSAANIGRASTAARGVGRTMKESADVNRANENAAALQQQYTELEAQFKAETDALSAKYDAAHESLEKISLKPKKTDISVTHLTLVWLPHQRSGGELRPVWE
ncbi:MAG TPA: ATP-binding protein [Planctomycetota bacterium]|nr:ATP-binding protein [Planctomycetota bacterium]